MSQNHDEFEEDTISLKEYLDEILPKSKDNLTKILQSLERGEPDEESKLLRAVYNIKPAINASSEYPDSREIQVQSNQIKKLYESIAEYYPHAPKYK